MGVGNTVYGTNATASGGTYTIQPTGTNEYVIHNLFWTGPCTITITDGSNPVLFFTADALGYLANVQLHVTNAFYITMTDTSGSTNNMAYDGIQTV